MLKQRGDTIIEVLLAFTVFSLVSVGAMTVMGQGSNASQRALEITLVRQQIDAQAEALRAAQQAYTASAGDDTEWKKFALAGIANNSQHFNETASCPTTDWINGARVFIMQPRTATLVTGTTWYKDINGAAAPPYAQVQTSSGVTQSYGIWIERSYESSETAPSSYDFNVRACWFGAGLDIPMQIETSVRLYEPGS